MEEPTSPKKPFSFFRSILFWSFLLVSLLALGLALDWRWLRGNDEYRWRYYALPGMEQRVWLTAVICLAVGLILFLVVHWAMIGRENRPTWLLLGLLFLSAVALQLAVLRLEHPDPLATLFYRTVSTRNLGAFYFDATTTTDINERLRQFPQLMPDFNSLSPRTHPPGLQVLFWGAGRLLAKIPLLSNWLGPQLRRYLCNDPGASPIFFYPNSVLSAAWLQILMPLWGALTLFPFYGLARRLFDRRTAVTGVVLLILAPAMVLFAAHWAHFYTLLALLALYFLYRGLLAGSWWPLLVSGLLVSLASFLSFSNLTLAALMGITLLVYWFTAWRPSSRSAAEFARQNWRPFLFQTSAFTVGVLGIWLLYYLAFGVTFFEVYRQGLLSHTKITGYRTYSLWLGYNLFDFFLFLGIPTVLALLVMIWRQIKPKTGEQRFNLQSLPFWSFLLTLVALDLSGISKGEVARLWMFLVPLAILAILPVVKEWRWRPVAGVVIILLFQVLVMGYYIRTIGSTNYPYYMPRVVETAVPTGVEPMDAAFSGDETLLLRGYELPGGAMQPGETVNLTLYWEADRPLNHAYTVFTHLVDPATGQIVAQYDSMPQQGTLPTLCWQKGEIVADTHPLNLAGDLPGGEYALQIGVYRLDLLQAGDPNHRLLVDPEQNESTLALTKVQVSAAE